MESEGATELRPKSLSLLPAAISASVDLYIALHDLYLRRVSQKALRTLRRPSEHNTTTSAPPSTITKYERRSIASCHTHHHTTQRGKLKSSDYGIRAMVRLHYDTFEYCGWRACWGKFTTYCARWMILRVSTKISKPRFLCRQESCTDDPPLKTRTHAVSPAGPQYKHRTLLFSFLQNENSASKRVCDFNLLSGSEAHTVSQHYCVLERLTRS